MINLLNIYHRLPVFLQNLCVSAEGFKIRRQRYNKSFNKFVEELNESQWYPEEKIKEIQWQNLKKMIVHAYNNVPYYRKVFKKTGLLPTDIKETYDLEKIPIIEKRTIRENRDDFIAKNFSKGKLTSLFTGGTTGTALSLYTSSDGLQFNFACAEARLKHWAGVKSGDKLVSFIGRMIVPPKTTRPPFWRYNCAYNQMLFSSFHMSDDNLGHYLEKFNSFKPTIVQGYPSTVHRFATYILNHGRQAFSPKAILTSSETLLSWQRKDIEKAFGARVYNSYSSAEFTAFISECADGNLHISPEYGLVEFKKIDQEKYEIISTTLFNFAMPLIRYRIGDIVVPSQNKKCACGRELPLVESIEGRIDSMLITSEGNYISSAAMSLVFQASKNIREAQIIQTANDKIVVRVVKEKEFANDDLKYLTEQLRLRVGYRINIDFEFADKIERTKSGKFNFIISGIKK